MPQNIGTVVQIIGAVLDIKFPPEKLPNLLNAIEIEHEGKKLTVEVAGTRVIGSACLVFGYCLACRSVYGENGHTGRGLYKRRYELRKEQFYLIDLSLCEKICRYLRYIGTADSRR